MKYIPGYTFTMGAGAKPTGGSLLQNKNKSVVKDDKFKHGNTYTLFNIKHINEGFCYVFINRTSNNKEDKIELNFDNIECADNKINSLIGVK